MRTLPMHEEGAARSVLLVPAIVTALLVVTVVPAAVILMRSRRERRALDARIADAIEEGRSSDDETRATSREAYVEAVRAFEGSV